MNNKRRNRKGFTIVELSIVIAVIAILAAVMIPTFSNIISKSNDAADRQNAKTVYSNYIENCIEAEKDYVADTWVKLADDKYVQIDNGAAETIDDEEPDQYLDENGTPVCKGVNADVAEKNACDWCQYAHKD